jgi:hypothetical protein
MDTTVELDRAEVLAVLQRSKDKRAEAAGIAPKSAGPNQELREALQTIKHWAEANGQWLVILAPWGMHHYGVLSEDQVELILKRFGNTED